MVKSCSDDFFCMSFLKDFMHTMSFRWWIKNQKEQVLGWCPMWCPNIMNMGLYEDAWDCAIDQASWSEVVFLIWGLYYGEINPANGSMLGVCITTMLKTPLVSATTSGCKGRRIISGTDVWLNGLSSGTSHSRHVLKCDLSKAFKQTKRFMEFVSDFTPCMHDILSNLMVMILCVYSRIHIKSVLERLTLLRESILKKVCAKIICHYAIMNTFVCLLLMLKPSSSTGALATHDKGSHVDICNLVMQ